MLGLMAAATMATAQFSATYAFGRQPQFTGIDISPNGEMIAVGYYDPGEQSIRIYDLARDEILDSWEVEDDSTKSVFFWKRDDLLVFGTQSLKSRKHIAYGVSTLETKTPGEPDFKPLYPGLLNAVLDKDNVLSRLSQDPDHIMVVYKPNLRSWAGVYKINLDDPSEHEEVIKPTAGALGYMSDGLGQIRGRIRVQQQGYLVWSLKKPNGGWRNVSRRIRNDEIIFEVYGFPKDLRYAYVGSNHETDTEALYLYDIQKGKFAEQLFHDPASDLYGIVQRVSDGELIGVKYADSRVRIHWLEDEEEKHRTELLRNALGADLVQLIAITPDEKTAAYSVLTGSRPAQMVVFDLESYHYYELPSQYPELDGVELGKVISTHYKARDGLEIPAFVTLPKGVRSLSEARNLQFVVLPHGGPHARDFESFDWLSQFLSWRGYGVLQMNFRGSSGYGQEFQEQGEREWGQAMQDDVTDGTRWLIEQGFADPDGIAIAGSSYGGYTALMGAIGQPDLYQCTISINGVTDLVELIKDTHPSRLRITRRIIGRLWGNRSVLQSNSPTSGASQINVPVLLVQSERDQVVPKRQAVLMRDALNAAERDVTYVELPNGSHYLNVGHNRITMLRAVEDFLYKCMDEDASKY
ncbi:MAG: prolyl oligopeptidase family serine peptidase [Pseudomonadota bacterium]